MSKNTNNNEQAANDTISSLSALSNKNKDFKDLSTIKQIKQVAGSTLRAGYHTINTTANLAEVADVASAKLKDITTDYFNTLKSDAVFKKQMRDKIQDKILKGEALTEIETSIASDMLDDLFN